MSKQAIQLLTLLGLFSLSQTLTAQSPEPSYLPPFGRLERLRPPYPYDNSGEEPMLSIFAPILLEQPQGWLRPLLTDLALGKNWTIGKHWTLGIDGLAFTLPTNNQIDGQWLGDEIMIARQLGWGRKLVLRSALYYALRSHHWYSESNLIFHYAPLHEGQLVLSGGYTSRSPIFLTSTERYTRHYTLPPIGSTPLQNYCKHYLALRHRISPTDRIELSLTSLWEDRKPQESIPDNTDQHHRAWQQELQASWVAIPYIDKIPSPNPYEAPHHHRYNPLEIGLNYRFTIPLHKELPSSDYKLLIGWARGSATLNPDHKLDYTFTVGQYLSRKNMSALDEYYLPSAPTIIAFLPMTAHWNALPHDWATDKKWMTAEANYYANGLPLSKLWRLLGGGKLPYIDEAIHAKYYLGQHKRQYIEAGYSFGWGNMARLGFFVGHEWGTKGLSYAFHINLPMLLIGSSWGERY